MKKTFENEGGNIIVRASPVKFGCGIVEMMYMWSENKSGCVIACWRRSHEKDDDYVQFESIGDRFAKTKYSFDIMEAVQYGQKLAELLIGSDTNGSN